MQDNGPGISEANLSKVFDPFFTTKEVGKGTGLGLSLCYGIVKDHGGTIVVRSKPGDGATFIIEFPIASEAADAIAEPESPRKGTESPSFPQEGAGKKVLVIDDEEAILQMVKDILTNQGYAVDVARDGEAALRSMRQNAYDLALCDWKMPGLSGEQVYEEVVTSIPAMSEKFIFFTGDVINDKAQQFLESRRRICLPKPFSLQEFRSAISQAMATN
jgi:CheY-like chemotaxis protein